MLRFFAKVVAWLLVLTLAWSQFGKWTSQPVGWLTQAALHMGVGDWVRQVHMAPGVIEVQTRLEVAVNGQWGEVEVSGDPAHLSYGLPILWALLLASGGWRRWRGMLMGMVALWPAQVFSLYFDLVKKMAMAVPGGAGALRIDQWQLEGIALGYQLGTLMMPTVVPILLWLWLDRAFVRETLIKPREVVPAV